MVSHRCRGELSANISFVGLLRFCCISARDRSAKEVVGNKAGMGLAAIID